VTIRIVRDYIDPYADPNDPSEKDLDDCHGFDYVIYNNSTLDVLRERAKQILVKEGLLREREP